MTDVVARSVGLHFGETLRFHQRWPDIAESAKELGHTYKWDSGEAALLLVSASPSGVVRVDSASLQSTTVGSELPRDLVELVFTTLELGGLNHLHSIVNVVSPIKSGYERAKGRTGNRLFGSLILAEDDNSHPVSDWFLRLDANTECAGFEFAKIDLGVVDKEAMKKRMPDEGKLTQKKLPKVGLWSGIAHHHHGQHDGADAASVWQALDDALEESLGWATAALGNVQSAIQ